jgi:hypothetical protein
VSYEAGWPWCAVLSGQCCWFCAGRTRLVNELGQKVMCISLTLRKDGDTGYPSGDPEISRFLLGGSPLDNMNVHARVIALLGSVTQIYK